tara:strand:- start:23362 stop:23562 length:201 start_codon:yes stop_codon:yes gene_type:complete
MKNKLNYYDELTLRVLVRDKIHELNLRKEYAKDDNMDYGLYHTNRIAELKEVLEKLYTIDGGTLGL